MNIEISEVFVLYTNSMSTVPNPVPVGVAALVPRPTRTAPNLKHWRIPTIFELATAFLIRLAPKQPKRPFLPDPMFRKVEKLDRFLTIS
jgi:hypothetical protein